MPSIGEPEIPDVARLAKRFGRIHHFVDYSQFKVLRLVPREPVKERTGVNNYGMTLKRVEPKERAARG